MARVLGLDMGSNSVGWALIDTELNDIIGMGVRIFPEGVESTNSEKEQSRNVTRREKRQLRRQYERRRMRKDAVRRMLWHHGLLPKDPDEFTQVLQADPYALRAAALSSPLALHEIGRIVDHITARRGFQSNRKSSSEEESSGTIYDGAKDGTKPGISEIDNALNPDLRRFKTYETSRNSLIGRLPSSDGGFRTAGEYLHSLNPHVRRRRCRFTLRDHYKIELDLILRIQAQHHPTVLTQEVIDQIMTTVFFQRPLRSARHLVGACRFEPGKKRVHRSHPEFQRFRMLQQINALRIRTYGRIEEEDMVLTPLERPALLFYLEQHGSVDLTKPMTVKKALGWKEKFVFQPNLEKIDGPTTYRKLADAIGASTVKSMTRDQLHDLWNILNFAEDEEWFLSNWEPKHGAYTSEQRQALAKIRLEQGYGSLSLRAVRKILPFLEEGMMYHDAATAAGYVFTDSLTNVPVGDRVPSLAPEDARNPIVQRSFAETRRVVNAIVRKWGNPDVIRIELGRELRLPKFKRVDLQKTNYKNRDANTSDRERLKEEYGIEHGSRADVLKYRLWREQGRVCIYTGQPISQNMLYGGAVDIDHILPYSRTLDDGRENKVLCLREINARKGDLTPMEACARGIIDEASFKERVNSLVRNNALSAAKQRRLLMTPDVFAERFSSDENTGFIARQLNDTRFAARLATKYLRHVSPKIEAVTGQMTSLLRYRWGLEGVLPELASEGRAWSAPDAEPGRKDRNDHRHHAIDALTVALTDRTAVTRIASMNARTGNAARASDEGRLDVPEPAIPGIRGLAKRMIDNVIVSHRVSRPGRGAFHEETLYGIARDRSGEHKINENEIPLYVVRKPLTALTANEITNIVDPVVRSLVYERLMQMGIDPFAGKFVVPKDAFAEPLHQRSSSGSRGHIIRRVRVFKASRVMRLLKSDGPFIETGGNDRMLISAPDKKSKVSWNVLTYLDVARNVELDFRPELTIRIGTTLDLREKGIYRVQKINRADGQVTLRHHAAASIMDNASRELRSPNTLNAVPVGLSVLGLPIELE